MANVKLYFGVGDIIVFTAALVLASSIGVYYAYKDRNKKNIKNYYYGGKNMSPIPLGLSISVTFISAITVMGYPADTYTYGFIIVLYSFTMAAPTVIACIYYIPLVHRLQLTTIYELLEFRFNRRIRKLASGIEMVNQIMYMGFTIYLPSLALNAVTPLQLYWTLALTGGICTFYTVLGGIKAVVWTDTLQAVFMMTGTIAALIKGAIEVGGFGNIWDAMERGGRLNVWDFDPDPRYRNTVWTILVGFGFGHAAVTCVNQSICQRYLSCRSVNDARIAATISVFLKIFLGVICSLGGAIAYAYFEGCDPLKTGEITRSDQLMPYFVIKLFKNIPGLSGFYVAAVFSGTLSTVSSGINSVGAMVLEDFVLTLKPKLSRANKMTISKVTVFLLGFLVTGISYLPSFTGASAIKIVMLFRGSCGGPILGIFTLAIFFPWSNSKGAFAGLLVGTVVTFWLAIGSFIYGISPQFVRKLPTTVDFCANNSSTTSYWTTRPINFQTESTSVVEEKIYPAIYSLSFIYYTCLGCLIAILIGLTVSFLTGSNNPKECNPKYFMPIVENRHLPAKVRSFFRFGVPMLTSNENTTNEDAKATNENDEIYPLNINE